MLNITPVRIDRDFQWTCCLDDNIATVTNYYGIEYRFAYPETWNFKYTPWAENESPKFRDHLDTLYVLERYGFLERYHRIKMLRCETGNTNELIQAIKRELSCNRPMSIRMDSYYLPWDAGYHRFHTNHVCIPVDINMKEGTLSLIDPFNMMTGLQFPISGLSEASGFYVTYDLDRANNENFDRVGIFQEVLTGLLHGSGDRNAFTDMRLFAEEFRQHFSPEIEFADSGGAFGWKPLHSHFINLAFGRSFFNISLRYIAEKENNELLMKLAVNFKRMISKINMITAMMRFAFRGAEETKNINSSFSTDYKKTIDKVCDILLEEADYEEKTARMILQALESPGKRKQSTHPAGKENTSAENVLHCVHVSLDGHFNNKAFGRMEPPFEANFTGVGEFMLVDGIPESRSWSVEDMSFLFPEVRGNGFDNITCNEQILLLDSVHCNRICILAAAEWGDFFEAVRLQTKDGEVEEVNVGVSDFAFETKFGEKIAWTGKSAVYNDGEAKIFQQNAKIFAVSAKLDHTLEISSIHLPFCTKMHIFAITLDLI
jgi:hypothetical protein